MNKDIKEILDKLKDTADNTIFVVAVNQEELDRVPKSMTKILSIPSKDAKILLDYITELQTNLKNMLDDNIDNTNKIRKAIEILKSTMYPDIARQKALNILEGDDKDE